MDIGSKFELRDRWMGILIRLQRRQWIISGCVTAILLPLAVGSALMIAQPPPMAAADDSVTTLSEAYNLSGHDLFSQLAAKPGNIVFSPYSIGTAMALALTGARGETEAEMVRVLRHRMPRTEVASANGKMLAILDQYGRGSLLSPRAARLTTANAVMLTPMGGTLISNDYLAGAKANFAAEIFRNADLAVVNDWGKRKTEGKIEQIIDKIDPQTVAVLLNAVYLKAQWQRPFDPKLTRTQEFSISPSQKVSVPIMYREAHYPMVNERGFDAIRVPYQVPQLHMVIILPKHINGLDQVAANLDGISLGRLFARLEAPGSRVELGLPRFKAKFEIELKNHFRALGMTQAFSEGKADFSGMTGGSAGIFINDVSHRAVIEVTEEGTEAAAATAVFMLASALPQFHVTRPFLFYIVDAATNAILFQGRIVDPS